MAFVLFPVVVDDGASEIVAVDGGDGVVAWGGAEDDVAVVVDDCVVVGGVAVVDGVVIGDLGSVLYLCQVGQSSFQIPDFVFLAYPTVFHLWLY
jgi:hypothetical protein